MGGLFSSLRRGGAVDPEYSGIAREHHYAPPWYAKIENEYATSQNACKLLESI